MFWAVTRKNYGKSLEAKIHNILMLIQIRIKDALDQVIFYKLYFFIMTSEAMCYLYVSQVNII